MKILTESEREAARLWMLASGFDQGQHRTLLPAFGFAADLVLLVVSRIREYSGDLQVQSELGAHPLETRLAVLYG